MKLLELRSSTHFTLVYFMTDANIFTQVIFSQLQKLLEPTADDQGSQTLSFEKPSSLAEGISPRNSRPKQH